MHRDKRVFPDADSAMPVENGERSDVDLGRDVNFSAPGFQSDMIIESGVGSDFNAGCARKRAMGFYKDSFSDRNGFCKRETGDRRPKGDPSQRGNPLSTSWGSRKFL